MNNARKKTALLLIALLMIFSLCSCGGENAQQTAAASEHPEPVTEYKTVSGLTDNFNPFTAEEGDYETARALSVTIGEATKRYTSTNGDGTFKYVYTFKDSVQCPQGDELGSSDAVFTLYVLADPAYTGERGIGGLPIEGMQEYRAGMSPLWTIISADFRAGTEQGSEYYTQDELDEFRAAFDTAGQAFVGEIVEYCAQKYADSRTEDAVGVDAETVKTDEGYKTAFAMWCWQFASGLNDQGLFCTLGGKEYDLKTNPPTKADFWELITDTYGYDMSEQGIDYEKAPEGATIEEHLQLAIEQQYPELNRMVATGQSAAEISGIEKIDEKSFSVTTTQMTDGLEDIIIVPMKDYPELEKGNVSPVLSAQGGRGAGKYMLESFSQGQAVLVPNENYFGIGSSVDRLIYKNS